MQKLDLLVVYYFYFYYYTYIKAKLDWCLIIVSVLVTCNITNSKYYFSVLLKSIISMWASLVICI